MRPYIAFAFTANNTAFKELSAKKHFLQEMSNLGASAQSPFFLIFELFGTGVFSTLAHVERYPEIQELKQKRSKGATLV